MYLDTRVSTTMAEDGKKVHGTRNEYRQVKEDDYLLVDGLHEVYMEGCDSSVALEFAVLGISKFLEK